MEYPLRTPSADPIRYYWEDFTPGWRYESNAASISAAAIKRFAQEYDPQSYHTDETAAKATPFGGLIASGWHTCAMAMRLDVRRLPAPVLVHRLARTRRAALAATGPARRQAAISRLGSGADAIADSAGSRYREVSLGRPQSERRHRLHDDRPATLPAPKSSRLVRKSEVDRPAPIGKGGRDQRGQVIQSIAQDGAVTHRTSRSMVRLGAGLVRSSASNVATKRCLALATPSTSVVLYRRFTADATAGYATA